MALFGRRIQFVGQPESAYAEGSALPLQETLANRNALLEKFLAMQQQQQQVVLPRASTLVAAASSDMLWAYSCKSLLY